MATKPNYWKRAFLILALVSLIVIGYLALRLFEQSATLAMVRDGYHRREVALSMLRQSLPELMRLSGHVSQTNILAILQKYNQEAPIVSGPSSIEMDQMRFRFAEDGSVERVERTDDYGTRAGDAPRNRPTMP